jgi:hypothetical protein
MMNARIQKDVVDLFDLFGWTAAREWPVSKCPVTRLPAVWNNSMSEVQLQS